MKVLYNLVLCRPTILPTKVPPKLPLDAHRNIGKVIGARETVKNEVFSGYKLDTSSLAVIAEIEVLTSHTYWLVGNIIELLQQGVTSLLGLNSSKRHFSMPGNIFFKDTASCEHKHLSATSTRWQKLLRCLLILHHRTAVFAWQARRVGWIFSCQAWSCNQKQETLIVRYSALIGYQKKTKSKSMKRQLPSVVQF